MASEWITAQELAGLPGVPNTVQGIHHRARRSGWQSRQRKGRGGGREYAVASLPPETQAALLRAAEPAPAEATPATTENPAPDRESRWAAFEKKPQRQKDAAARRLHALDALERLAASGVGRSEATSQTAVAWGESRATVYRWRQAVQGIDRPDWLPALVPAYQGRQRDAECSAEAWELFKALYLTRAQRSVADCYRRVAEVAAERGLGWPSKKTIERRVRADITRRVRVLLREGPEAAENLVPPMERDRSGYHAMQAVNGDGVEFKCQCQWPDGSVAHAKIWFWQDLYSGRLLTWRADQSENKDVLRLAFGDLVEGFGIPSYAFIDNTTAAASKWLTGGVANRYRWRIRDEDPLGLMPQVGTRVHFVRPAHGQAKPIERAFRDLRQLIDKSPHLEGRGTQAKPVPIEAFMEVVNAEVARHNAIEGRRTAVAQGRSFDAVFADSYARSPIRRATEEQRRLWLLAAERVRAHRDHGAIVLGRGPQGENRYWHERLAEHAGAQLVVRFDPAALHQAVHVYTLDGRYLAAAECTWRAGFADSTAARDYHRYKGRYKRATKAAAAAERGMSLAAATEQLTQPEPTDPPDRQVVQGQFSQQRGKRAAGSDIEASNEEEGQDDQREARFNRTVTAIAERWRDEQL